MRRISIILIVLMLTACGKEAPKPQAKPPAEVTAIQVKAADTPVISEYVGQTESSRQVQIVARVSGFLEKRVYTEGNLVKAGDVMFLQDAKPFQAQLNAAKGALAEQQARLETARSDLARVRPLVELNALSQKNLDDATGREQAASASVQMAEAQLEQARLDLGYTTIRTPVTGLSSFSRVQEGAYVNPQNSLLTYVSQVDPIWINFTISENELLALRAGVDQGKLRTPADNAYEVVAVLADGSVFPHKGRITFADAEFNQQTGTYLLRATLPNPEARLKPGQFVRARVSGNVRPNAILVPQKAVMQGAQGHFVFVVIDGKAQARPVKVGEWYGTDWFIEEGLQPGDVVITEGMMKVAPGADVTLAGAPAAASANASGKAAAPAAAAVKP